MKNISTGFGLCVAAATALAYPFVSSLAPNANASAVTAAVAAVSTAATAQSVPTIVWYQAFAIPSIGSYAASGIWETGAFWIVRAWSDGRIEGRCVRGGGALQNCNGTGQPCVGPWVTISDPSQGYTYRSDINFDSKVDGADLGTLLADWGDAPRRDIPPSDCPLNLINP